MHSRAHAARAHSARPMHTCSRYVTFGREADPLHPDHRLDKLLALWAVSITFAGSFATAPMLRRGPFHVTTASRGSVAAIGRGRGRS